MTATLTGSLNPEGTPTSARFEYGTTTAYGSETSIVNAGAGTADVPLSTEISDLAPNTRYHYRVVALRGTTVAAAGIEGTFRTPSFDPEATTGAATAVTQTTATLTGSVNPRGSDTSAWFKYGPTTAHGSQTGVDFLGGGTVDVPLTAHISGLAPSTTYHYTVVAWRGPVVAATGVDRTFHTPPGPPPPVSPTATTSSATGVTATTALLRGTVDPRGTSTSDRFEYGTTTAYAGRTTTRFAGTGSGGVEIAAGVSGLAPETTYHYRVTALRGTTTVATGADRTFHTSAPPSPPAPPPPRAHVRRHVRAQVSIKGSFRYAFIASAGATGTASFKTARPFKRGHRRRTLTIARRSWTASRSGRVRLKVKLSERERRVLGARRTLKLRVRVAVAGGSARKGTLTLSAPRRRRR